MKTVLDPSAPSLNAEYVRYLDGDLLGKIVARNLFTNRLGYPPESIFTPLGRYGNANVKYKNLTAIAYDPGDDYVIINGMPVTFEIKFAPATGASLAMQLFHPNKIPDPPSPSLLAPS